MCEGERESERKRKRENEINFGPVGDDDLNEDDEEGEGE